MTKDRSRSKRRAGFIAIAIAVAVLAGPLAWMAATSVPPGTTRTYYMAADEVEWDYAPLGYNGISGEPFGDHEDVFVENTAYSIGSTYVKALYREYTDGTFTTLKPVPPAWAHLGTLGPLIRAAVGDTIVVVFKNNARFPFSVHPHGVFYLKDSEGAPYADGTTLKADDLVGPGQTHTYTWPVPERAGPGPMDGSSILWMYHSHVDEPGDTNAGLIGSMIIARRGSAAPDAVPMDVDREFVTMFTVFDENRSPYLRQNIETYVIAKWWPKMSPSNRESFIEDLMEDDAFVESNLMHSINGYVFGNLPGLVMDRFERVRWYLLGMGTEVDLHTPHWHGQTVVVMGMRTDIAELLPASMKIADMVPDNVGTWLYHCHVNDHIDAGMLATFTVR
ncbi:MAG TPA: multicopper oxidase domain-containing protein [Thermoplasmata archaeon]|nr:multicopper oxidase domain-containing protein [Thermoplasmata archaeon]